MGQRVYIVPIDAVSIGTAVQDIFALKSGATNGIEIHHIHLEFGGVSAAAEIRMRLKRASATMTLGSGGSAPTPALVDESDSAAATTAHINDTSQATTSGAFTTLAGFNPDVLVAWDHLPAPEDREICKAGGGGFVLDLPATIVATTVSGYIKFRELP
jgi:hypothetical protein